LGLACAYRVFSRGLVGFRVNGVYQECNYPFASPIVPFPAEAPQGKSAKVSPGAFAPVMEEGKGGKVKSQVAYDTVLEIGGRLDDGVL
jgi:hypothetical protein